MNRLIDDLRPTIKDLFEEAVDLEDLRETYYAIRSEADKQFVILAQEMIERRNEE